MSLGLHLFVIAAVIVWPSGGQKRILFAPTYQVSLVAGPPPSAAPAAKPAVKPEPAPPKKATPKVAPKPKPKPKPKVAIGTKKTAKRITRKKKKKAEPDPDKILAQRLSRMQSRVKQEKALEAALSKVESKVGSAAATGGYARPGGGNEMSARFQLYYTELWERIRRSWNLPEALTGNTKGRMAVVTLRIRRDGTLEKFWLEESSGNARLDQSALRAVEKAAPFPPLPGGYPRPTHEVGIRFRPDEAGG